MIRKKYDDLGKPSYEEWVVGFHFVTLGLFLDYSLKKLGFTDGPDVKSNKVKRFLKLIKLFSGSPVHQSSFLVGKQLSSLDM